MESEGVLLMYQDMYERWLAAELDDADLKPELESVKGDDAAIQDRFAVALKFGTAGLRGVIGAGTNRMNIYVVRQATQGLANWVKTQGGSQTVAISYDSRIKSDLFARTAAEVLAANGIKVRIYSALMPVPALSFATRYYNCNAGIMVTASHNPAKYNGYKVYGADGCQITLEVAAKILAAIEAVDCFAVQPADFDVALAEGKIEYSSEKCLDDFVDAVYAQRVGDGAGTADLKLVYTPLNGSGLECVKKLLAKLGVTHVTVVPEQEKPDGNFPTCPYPNPEIREAMQKGLELCDQVHPDLLLGTDPDCDRVGVVGNPGGQSSSPTTSTIPKRPSPRSTGSGSPPATWASWTPRATCASLAVPRKSSSCAGRTITPPTSSTSPCPAWKRRSGSW